MEETMLDWALRYAALGWHVFPCHKPFNKQGLSCSCETYRRRKDPNYDCPSPGKHPRTRSGLEDATTSIEEIKRWWQWWPEANIGVNCGKSGLLVLDLDKYKDAYQGHNLELDEETITAISGGGGTHLFYRLEPSDTFGNSTKGLPPGIDIRGHGGYVIVAPSLHISGNRYHWEIGYEPWN